MSDTFANEFEKWLEKKTDDINSDEVEDDGSYEESDNDSEYAMNTANNDESESDMKKYQDQLLDRQGKLISGSINDQAPILVDDDDCDDVFPREKQQFEDEPPVLEPAPKQMLDYKMTKLGIPRLSSQNCIHNYSRLMQYGRSSLHKHKYMKTYSKDKKTKHLSETCIELSHKDSLKSKDNGSGNIFDKFKSDSYEHFPPPLIPSPEALQLPSELPKTDYKHPSHSPDFCAMEADSTSEITGDKACSLFYSRRLSKYSVHGDVSIECDSTCMLAGSPMIVSPASVSNGEVEEVRDSGGGKTNCDMQSSDSACQKFNKPFCTKADNELPLEVMREPTILVCDVMSETALTSDSCHRGSTIQWTEEPQTHHCPDLPVMGTYKAVCKSLSLNVSAETESCAVCDFPNEPPTLSIITPPVKTHRICRKKRHTIDSPENFSRSGKRHHAIYSLQPDEENAEFYISTPPTLTHISETIITLSNRGKRSKVVSRHSKDYQSCLQGKNILPSANLIENSSSLSEDLPSFVINMSQLSQLQTHMHMLLYQLFPELRTELDAMCPESPWFKSLLSNLMKLLEQPCLKMKVQDNSIPSLHLIGKEIEYNSFSESSFSNIPKSSYTSQNANCNSSSHDSQAADIVKHVSISDSACSVVHPLGSSNPSHYYTHKRHFCRVRQQNDSWDHESDLVIPHLSQMTLRDVEELIRPSKVKLYRNPGALLKGYVELSCRVLQLLLPDLTVSLFSEFAESPHDLVSFIENVIMTNSKQK